jgi:hypothetical protein
MQELYIVFINRELKEGKGYWRNFTREQHPSVLQNILQFMSLHQQQSSTENDSAITFL